jgi:hypothetical protein
MGTSLLCLFFFAFWRLRAKGALASHDDASAPFISLLFFYFLRGRLGVFQ